WAKLATTSRSEPRPSRRRVTKSPGRPPKPSTTSSSTGKAATPRSRRAIRASFLLLRRRPGKSRRRPVQNESAYAVATGAAEFDPSSCRPCLPAWVGELPPSHQNGICLIHPSDGKRFDSETLIPPGLPAGDARSLFRLE